MGEMGGECVGGAGGEWVRWEVSVWEGLGGEWVRWEVSVWEGGWGW